MSPQQDFRGDLNRVLLTFDKDNALNDAPGSSIADIASTHAPKPVRQLLDDGLLYRNSSSSMGSPRSPPRGFCALS